jgi:uncharacterized membrane protein
LYELGMMITGILCLPIAILQWLLRIIFGFPNERFAKDMEENTKQNNSNRKNFPTMEVLFW